MARTDELAPKMHDTGLEMEDAVNVHLNVSNNLMPRVTRYNKLTSKNKTNESN